MDEEPFPEMITPELPPVALRPTPAMKLTLIVAAAARRQIVVNCVLGLRGIGEKVSVTLLLLCPIGVESEGGKREQRTQLSIR